MFTFWFTITFIVSLITQTLSGIDRQDSHSSSDFDWMSVLQEPIDRSLLNSPVHSSDNHHQHYTPQSTFHTDPVIEVANEKDVPNVKFKVPIKKDKITKPKMTKWQKELAKPPEEREKLKQRRYHISRRYRERLKKETGYYNRIDVERNRLGKLVEQGIATPDEKEKYNAILYKTRDHRRFLDQKRKLAMGLPVKERNRSRSTKQT